MSETGTAESYTLSRPAALPSEVKAGHEVTVWNRSPQRMAPLVALGAKEAENMAAAVQAIAWNFTPVHCVRLLRKSTPARSHPKTSRGASPI